MKKISKLLLAFLLVGSAVYSGGLNTSEVNAETSVVMPDLTGYEMPEELVNENDLEPVKVRNSKMTQNTDRQIGYDMTQEDLEALKGRELASEGMSQNDKTRSMDGLSVGDTKTIYDMKDINRAQFDVVMAAESANARVFVAVDNNSSSPGYDAYQEFKPTGTTPSSSATEIVNEFEEIYTLMNPAFGRTVDLWQTSKVDIILYDVDWDGNSTGGYTAGYFIPADLIQSSPSDGFYTNEDSIVYMDSGKTQGFNDFVNYKDDFYGTLAHEYQHLIHGTHWIGKYMTNQTDDGIAVWYNEGLSGLAGSMYVQNAGTSTTLLNTGHYIEALLNKTPAGVGSIPTDDEWRNAGSRVYALYGFSNVLMNDYMERSDAASVKKLLETNKYGYDNSICNVAMNYKANSTATQTNCLNEFNNFYTRAMLNFTVDSPNGVGYATNSAANTWYDRLTADVLYGTEEYYGYAEIFNNTVATNSSGGSSYNTNVFLTSESVGSTTSSVEIEIPTNTSSNSAEYYIVTPDSTTGVNTLNLWAASNKKVGELKPGKQTVTVGTDNMFSIVSVNTDKAVNQTFKYRTVTPILSANDEIAPAATGVAPQATVADGTEYKGGPIVWKDASGNVVSGNFLPNVEYTAEVTLTANDGFFWDEGAVLNVTNGGSEIAGLEVVSTTISSDSSQFTYVVKFPATTGYLTVYDGTIVPLTGQTPASTINETEYSGTISWSHADGSPLTGDVEPSTVYFAEYTLKAAANYIWDDAVEVSVLNGTVSNVVVDQSDVKENVLTFKVEYAATPQYAVNPILNVVAPVTGEVAQTTVTPTEEYTGVITWSPELDESGSFLGATVYTAEVTLTTKDGYLWGNLVARNGALLPEVTLNDEVITNVTVSGDMNENLTFTYTFPTTIETILGAELPIASPVEDNTPEATITSNAYNGTIVWVDSKGENVDKFVAGEIYSATATLTVNEGYVWGENLVFNVANGQVVSYEIDPDNPNVVILNIVFDPAAEKPVVEVPVEKPAEDGLVKTGMVSYFSILSIISLVLIGSRKFLRK